MALYALDNVDDALDVTREFLGDIRRTTWLKLALVVFFVGGAGGGFPGFNVPGGGDGGVDPGVPPADGVSPVDVGPDVWVIVGAVVLAVLVIALAFALVGAVMEFVFVESLRSEVVSVREYWGRYWRKGLRLFGFRLVIGVFLLGGVALVGGLFAFPFLFDGTGGGLSVFLALGLIPVFVVLAILVGLVNGFTTAFVVPIMILEDCGVLEGWRRLWPTITAQWTQYLAYAVAAFVLSIAGGLFVFVVTAVLAIVLLIPFGILFAVGVGLLTVVEPVGVAWLVLTGIAFGLAVLVATALAQVPVQTYLRYYALLVLGDVEAAFDAVPEQRARVRDVDSEPDEPTGAV